MSSGGGFGVTGGTVGTGGADDCIPPPSSCDVGSPSMYPLDAARGCLGTPITLSDVCRTTVNRCAPSAGLGYVCVFAPDGSLFINFASDNYKMTAAAWSFVQQGVPSGGFTEGDSARCMQAQCLPTCPGVAPWTNRPFCGDAGFVAGDAAPVADDAPLDRSTPTDAPFDAPGRTPLRHRPASTACSAERPAATTKSDPWPTATCDVDSDCTAGLNGRCWVGVSLGGVDAGAFRYCSYDECRTETDCPSTGTRRVCLCRGPEIPLAPNRCVPAECSTDADCGPGSFCSPSPRDWMYPTYVVAGYFCHTPDDECIDDRDCDPPDAFSRLCSFDISARRWRCMRGEYCHC